MWSTFGSLRPDTRNRIMAAILFLTTNLGEQNVKKWLKYEICAFDWSNFGKRGVFDNSD